MKETARKVFLSVSELERMIPALKLKVPFLPSPYPIKRKEEKIKVSIKSYFLEPMYNHFQMIPSLILENFICKKQSIQKPT